MSSSSDLVAAAGKCSRVDFRCAAVLISSRTGGHCYLGSCAFTGPARAADRAAVLSMLTGSRVTKSRAGYTVFFDSLCAAAECFAGDCCRAVRADRLAERLRAAVAEVPAEFGSGFGVGLAGM
jgi:hypothetical protein